MVDVGLECAGDVPLAGREPLDTGQRLVARALELVVVELLGEIRIGVDDAYDRGAHAGVATHMSARIRSRPVRRFACERRSGPRLSGMDIERIPLGLAVHGELDAATAPALEDALREALLETSGAFVLDLSGLEFMDSSGVNALLHARALLGREERALALVCPPGQARRVLDLVGIARALHAVRHARRSRRRASALRLTRVV